MDEDGYEYITSPGVPHHSCMQYPPWSGGGCTPTPLWGTRGANFTEFSVAGHALELCALVGQSSVAQRARQIIKERLIVSEI